jgi:hypothetical protein
MNKSSPSDYQLAHGGPKPLKLGGKSPKRRGPQLGCGGKGAENSSQRHRFLPSFHRYIDNSGTPYGQK